MRKGLNLKYGYQRELWGPHRHITSCYLQPLEVFNLTSDRSPSLAASFFQDVRAHLFPASGEGPSGDGVRPRHAEQRREDRRDRDRPGESLPVQIRSHLWPATVLLCVSRDDPLMTPVIYASCHIFLCSLCPLSLSHTLSFCVSRPLAQGWTSGETSWHPGSCCTECVSGETCQSRSTKTT